MLWRARQMCLSQNWASVRAEPESGHSRFSARPGERRPGARRRRMRHGIAGGTASGPPSCHSSSAVDAGVDTQLSDISTGRSPCCLPRPAASGGPRLPRPARASHRPTPGPARARRAERRGRAWLLVGRSGAKRPLCAFGRDQSRGPRVPGAGCFDPDRTLSIFSDEERRTPAFEVFARGE